MDFKLKNGEHWKLRDETFQGWLKTYPGLDVHGEVWKARAWIEANPRRRKTEIGMERFLVNWLNKATASGGGRSIYRPWLDDGAGTWGR